MLFRSVSVIALELDGEPEINATLTDRDGALSLTGVSAKRLSADGEPSFKLAKSGIVEGWNRKEDYLSWEFVLTGAGDYQVSLHTFTEKDPEQHLDMSWEGGHEFVISCAGQEIAFTVTDDKRTHPRDLFLWEDVETRCGMLHIEKPGKYTLSLTPKKIEYQKGLGPKVKGVELQVIGKGE